MPLEILTQKHITAEETKARPTYKGKRIPVADVVAQRKVTVNSPIPAKVPVVHNFQHDLESIWWILLCTVTARPQHTGAHAWSRKVFRNTCDVSLERHNALITGDPELQTLVDPTLQEIIVNIDLLRTHLLGLYKERAQNPLLHHVEPYTYISALFSAIFDDMEKTRSVWGKTPLLTDYSVYDTVGPGELIPYVDSSDSSSNTVSTDDETGTSDAPQAPLHSKRPRTTSNVEDDIDDDRRSYPSSTSGKRSRH